MKYSQIIEKIENSRRFASQPGVEICRTVLEQLGNPQNALKFIHVAGTNGKGSVCDFLQEILIAAGYRVGMFTSPHLIEFTERIRINGQQIEKSEVKRFGEMLLEKEFGVELTMFDYCMAMAMLYFKEQNCDIVILETGLGGRLDATNVIEPPLVSVITKIGYDHTAILGDVLPVIASEKAGILKNGTKAVIADQAEQVKAVFREACESQQIPLTIVGKCDATIQKQEVWEGQTFTYHGETYRSKMLGDYQVENALLAIETARKLHIETTDIQKGVERAAWAGRMQVVCREPFLLVDGAHNPNGVAALKNSLMQLFPSEKFVFMMAVMADKDYSDMVEQMLPIAESFVTVTPESSRALQGQELAGFIREKGMQVVCFDSVDAALADYRANGTNRKTVAFGSLYFIGELLEKTVKKI